MNVLSLFDGMSCGRIALERLGIEVNNYYASEIDKYAIQIAQKNYPDTKQIGDVLDWQSWDIDWSSIDLVSGGFPCQSWSLAGKQLGDKDERGMMLWVMLDIMKKVIKHNPNAYYLMENVRMKKEFEEYITYHTKQALPDVNKYLINSALVSAQNRVRYYWTNIPNVGLPKDKGIVLKDILETETEEKPVKDTARNQRHYRNKDEKSLCMTATMYKGAGNNGMTLVPERLDNPKQIGIAVDINGHDILKRVYSENGKSPTLNACTGGNREPKVVCGAWRGRYQEDKSTKQMLELRKDDKTNTVTTVQKDNVIVSHKPNQINPSKKANGVQPYMQDRVFHVDGKSHALTREFASRTNVGDEQKMYWRKLTPLECERLQTVPDNYTEGVSNTQRYKMLGNGWTVDVIAHIFANMELDNKIADKYQAITSDNLDYFEERDDVR